MFFRKSLSVVLLVLSQFLKAQLPIAWDTISVFENNKVLKMPWANGINFANVSNADLNFDGKKDLVLFDKLDNYGNGLFRCFINTGNSGETKYFADPTLSYSFPLATYWAVLHDYDNDGKADIFCSTNSGIKVYKNTSNPPGLNFTLLKTALRSNYSPQFKDTTFVLFSSPVGVPGIADIDGDGDLDILTFSPDGVIIEFHKNMSIEKYGHRDSLTFELKDACWGQIAESSCTVSFGYCSSSKQAPVVLKDPSQKEYHAGSCLTCFDSDGDGDQDLIMGDILCKTLQYVHNTGSTVNAVFSDTTRLYPNFPNKNSTTQAKMNSFPAAYIIDANDDGEQDLIVTPNSLNSENYRSVWYYKNTSTTNTVNFQFVKDNFLQDEMIEVGQNSFPVLFDYDADGLKDLLIGNQGYYQGTDLKPRLTLYRNIGTKALPSFSLITRDYAGLSQYNLYHAIPTVGDIDNDLDVDICLGTSSGQIHWLENTAGAGNPCNFSIFKTNPFNFTTISSRAVPQLFDLNSDGKLDLLIGMQNGNIAYYANTGTLSGSTIVPSFSLVTNKLGSIDVKGDPFLYGLEGDATPFFFKENGNIKLLVGSIKGTLAYYDVPSNIMDTYNLINTAVNGYNEGGQSSVFYEDINDDGLRDMFIGNAGGGLKFYSSKSKYVSVNEFSFDKLKAALTLFPNPFNQTLNLRIDGIEFDYGQISLSNLLGENILKHDLGNNSEILNLSNLSSGVYFITTKLAVNQKQVSITKKIIKE